MLSLFFWIFIVIIHKLSVLYRILFVEYAIYFTNMLNKRQPVHTPSGAMVIRLSFLVTVHSVPSNVAKIHSRLPAAMEFWLVCLGILAYSCQNTSRDSGAWTVTFFTLYEIYFVTLLWTFPFSSWKCLYFSTNISRKLTIRNPQDTQIILVP